MQLNNNVSFKAVPGGQIKSLLAKNPEKLNEITQKLAPMGDKNSVVDIFYTSVRTQDNRNVKKFSLRLFNKVWSYVYFDSLHILYGKNAISDRISESSEGDM